MTKLSGYIYKLSMCLVFIGFVSCEDEDAIRIPETEKLVNFRIQRDVSSFDSTNPDAAVELTMYSESTNIDKVDMFVSHFSLIENSESDQFPLASLNGNEITNDGSTKRSFTLVELTAAMNKTPSDLAGGDVVNIYSIVTLTDGRVYPDTVKATSDREFLNVTPNIVNSSATTSFSPKLTFPILCEMDPTFGTGTYLFEVIEGENIEGFGGSSIFDDGVMVEVTSTSNTGRVFTVGYLSAFGFTTDISFDFACNVTLLGPTAAGVGCGFSITWDLNAANPGTFDISDDSEYTISIIHNDNGSCAPQVPQGDIYTFRLTKQ
jgi:hypothetical protein